jgi:undecaprenyl pyrophosphate phosphatase UppP
MLHLMNLMYVGPDQIFPLASILGAIGGALLIFWRHIVRIFKRVGRIFSKKKETAEEKD